MSYTYTLRKGLVVATSGLDSRLVYRVPVGHENLVAGLLRALTGKTPAEAASTLGTAVVAVQHQQRARAR